MSFRTSTSMSWHADGRTNDGNLRHYDDAEEWKSFNSRYPNFASNCQNVSSVSPSMVLTHLSFEALLIVLSQ